MVNEKNILQRIKNIVLDKDPSAKIYLYGSRARGTMKADSDWDILILLNGKKITIEVERNVAYPLYELEFETGEVIRPLIYSAQEWNSKYSITPFYSNFMKEGKLL